MERGIVGRVLVAVLVVALVGVMALGVAGPGALPDRWQGFLQVHTLSGSSGLTIHAFWCTSDSLALAWGTSTTDEVAAISAVMRVLGGTWPGREALLVTVITPEPGRFYWHPLRLVVTQGRKQFEISSSDVMKWDDAFGGGLLYETVIGWVALPEAIDIRQPFTLWYDEDSVTLGPFLGQ